MSYGIVELKKDNDEIIFNIGINCYLCTVISFSPV